jgi:phage terminase large subunit-like protein
MKLTVQIASAPDRDEVVAELWQGGDMLAEVQRAAGGQFMLEIYAKQGGSPWQINPDDLLAALTEAKKRLICFV